MNFNLFLLEAAATTGEANTQTGGVVGGLGMFLPIILMVALMYFLIIRPQKKKEKAEKAMRDNLQVGDEIITIGGIYGRVISLKEDTIVIESKSDHSKMTIARWAMQQNLTVHDDTPSK
jgi:preprotein translocase subunit YajC